jgi:invasion protein IalB
MKRFIIACAIFTCICGVSTAQIKEVVKARYAGWEIRCAPSGKDCFLYQLGKDASGEPVIEMSALKLPKGGNAAAGVTVVTPLGTLIDKGLTLQVDRGARRRYESSWCSDVGCFFRFGLDAKALRAFERGQRLNVVVYSAAKPNEAVAVVVPLKGFQQAYEALPGN